VKSNALNFLGVKPEEQSQVWLMLATGFFIGIFIATYQVTAESLFLNKLSDQLDKAFLISGVLGILSTAVFSFLQNRIRFITLSIISMALIVVATAALYFNYHSTDTGVQSITLFLMYCLIGPLTAILLLCYWGIFGRLFNFKQSKRIIGWIDTGQLIAIILANFLIPLTAKIFPDTADYLWVCNVSMAGALISLIIISVKFNLSRVGTDSSVRSETKFSKIFKDRYVVLLSIFLVTSMVTYVFNQYSFQTLLNTQYPEQRDLTNFLAFFNGAIYALSLLMQVFVNDKILSTYGIRISLFMLPAVIAILSIGSIVTGTTLGFTYENNSTFIYFFLFVALTRLFNTMLRDSLENPIYKLLFIPLDARLRFSIQAKVEGVVNESGRFIAGAFIFLFAMISGFDLIWIPVMVLGLLLIYFIVIRNLYAEYKEKIKSKLENTGSQQDALEVGYQRIVSMLEMNLTNREPSSSIFSYKLLEKIKPSGSNVWINTLMKSADENTRQFAQKKMNELKGLSVSENYVIKINKSLVNNSEKNILTKPEVDLILFSGGEIQKLRIQKLTRSQDANDRHYAAELLLHSSANENMAFLIELLNDSVPSVRRVAIQTSSKKYNAEVIVSLIENLAHPLLSNSAMHALEQIGQPALPLLDNSFYRSGQSTPVMIRIVQLIGTIGGARAKEYLWNKIDYPDKVVVSQVLLALGKSGFKAGMSQVSRIKYAIESDIADISWNLAAIEEVGSKENARLIRNALREEVQNDIEHVYILLAMLYDTRSIQLVRENIESGTAEGVTYAIELLDVFLSEQLKQRVIPVLDDISNSEKINRLDMFYPRITLDEQLVLKFIINRDFTQSNRWTKATVLHLIGELRLEEFTLDLTAHVYNPDKLIRETASWSLYQIDPKQYQYLVKLLGEEAMKSITEKIDISASGKHAGVMLFDKVKFFNRIDLFKGTPGLTLSYLADISQTIYLKEGESIKIDHTCNQFYMVYEGSVANYQNGNIHKNYEEGEFIGEQFVDSSMLNANLIKANQDTLLLCFNKDQFYELMADQIKLADKILEYV
jgi:ATP:ADP antiporter, AAA family